MLPYRIKIKGTEYYLRWCTKCNSVWYARKEEDKCVVCSSYETKEKTK